MIPTTRTQPSRPFGHQADAGLEPRDRVIPMGLAPWLKGLDSREPKLGMRVQKRRVVVRECGRQNAHNRMWLAIEQNLLADHIEIAAIALLPQPIAQHDGGFVLSVFLGQEQASAEGLDTEHGKQIGTNSLARDLLRLLLSSDVEEVRFKCRRAGEYLILFLPVKEIFARNNVLEPAAMRILLPEHD